VFEELLARFPDYEIAGEAEWLPSSLVRGPHAVPVTFA
jgi:cytochrome P450